MAKVIRLTENDLASLVKKIVNREYDFQSHVNKFKWDIKSFDCNDDFSDVPFENRKEIDYDFESNTISIRFCKGDEDNLADYQAKGVAQAMGYYGALK